jgi:hypothetical protein
MNEEKHPFQEAMVMLDIETMGLRQDSVVWEIGAILFEGYPSLETISECRWYLNMSDQESRFLDPKTVAWTSTVGAKFGPNGEQDMPRMRAFADAVSTGLSVKTWLGAYREWLKDMHEKNYTTESPCVWVWGPHFDIAMLENLIQSQNLGRAPWKYDKPMDCRTLDRLFTLFGGADEKNKDEVPHDALGDCRMQLDRLRECFKLLGGAFEK